MKWTILLLLLLVINDASAQKKFVKGKVVLSNGDNMVGLIDYRNWIRNPSEITYKNSVNATEQLFKPADLQSFEISGIDQYKSATVNIDMRPIATLDITPEQKDTSVLMTVFLRTIITGSPFDLYEYIDDLKAHYYIQKDNGAITELTFRRYATSDQNVITDYAYRQQLSNLVSDNDKGHLPKLDNVDYNEKDLKRAVLKVNSASNFEAGNPTTKKEMIQLFVGGGVALQSVSFTGPYYEGFHFGSYISPLLTGGIDIMPGRDFQRLIIRFDVSWYSYKGEASYQRKDIVIDQEYYSFQQRTISPSLGILYSFLNYAHAKVYAGGSMAYNFSSYPVNKNTTTITTSGNVYTRNPLRFEKTWNRVYLKAGAILNKQWEINVSLPLLGTFTNFKEIGEKGQKLFLSAMYRF